MKSLLVLTLFTVKVVLFPLVDAPVIVIKSNWLYAPKLVVPVLELLILYSVPVFVKLTTVDAVGVAICDFDASNVVLVCAIIVIYSNYV